MKKLFFLACLIGFFFLGIEVSKSSKERKTFPYLCDEKFISIILYARDQEVWIEKSLRSCLEQEYENYQVILILDGSSETSLEYAKRIPLEREALEKVLVIENEVQKGFIPCIQEVLQDLDSSEIILPFSAKDFLANKNCLKKINALFKNASIKVVSGKTLSYPAYAKNSFEIKAFRPPAFSEKAGKHKYKIEDHLRGKEIKSYDILLIHNNTAYNHPFR